MKVTPGRIVNYVFASGEVRPAVVVKVWDAEGQSVNLQVFVDGSNDAALGGAQDRGVVWATSATYQEFEGTRRTEPTPHTWHWPSMSA